MKVSEANHSLLGLPLVSGPPGVKLTNKSAFKAVHFFVLFFSIPAELIPDLASVVFGERWE